MAEKTRDKTMQGNVPANQADYDGVKFHTLAQGITTHPLIRSGKPCIEGTGLKVTDIVAVKNFQKMGPEDIARYFDIKVSQVYDALNYYALHTEYIDTDIELDNFNHEQLAEAQYGSSGNPVLSRRESAS